MALECREDIKPCNMLQTEQGLGVTDHIRDSNSVADFYCVVVAYDEVWILPYLPGHQDQIIDSFVTNLENAHPNCFYTYIDSQNMQKHQFT